MTPPLSALSRPIRFGTRGSALAMAQTDLAIARLHQIFPDQSTETRIIRTEGDIDRLSPLTEIGGRGVFTSALEQRIVCGDVDAAVHSAKDLPTALHPDVPIVAFPDRADPRDVLISRHQTTLDELPANPVIGTSSRRREAQILRLRPDARIRQIRGNIDTRVQKALGPEFDAVVLAAAGILRMGWGDRISEFFDVERFVPSPGQGAIAIQARPGTAAAALLSATDNPRISTMVRIERAFLAAVGAGCTMPVGAYVSDSGHALRLVALLADASGRRFAYANDELDAGDELRHAADIATRLLLDVGEPFSGDQWSGADVSRIDLAGVRVAVTRPRRQAEQLLRVLAVRGADAMALPTIRIVPASRTAELDAALAAAASGAFDWIAFTSANAVDAVVERLGELGVDVRGLATVRVAAIGQATAAAAEAAGFTVDLIPAEATGEALAAELRTRVLPGEKLLHPRSAIGRDTLREVLRTCGIEVVVVTAYEIRQEPEIDSLVLQRLRRGDIDAVTFASPSSVQNLVALLGDDRAALATIPAICAGPVTAEAAMKAGLTVGAVSAGPGPIAMADALAKHWRDGNNGKRPIRGGHELNFMPANEGSAE